MKKTTTFLFILAPLLGFGQWNFYHNIEIPPNLNCTIDFGNAIFVSADTGYYCYSEYCSPSSTSSNLRRTTNGCVSWQGVAGNSGMGYGAYAVKYFSPCIYFLHNEQGCLVIQCSTNGSNFQTLLFWGPHWYRDFYANSVNDYKLVLYGGDFAHYLNGELVKFQTFTAYQPVKLCFPIDTVGFFTAKRTSASILILKYTPTTGFHIVHEDLTVSFTSIGFTPDTTVFVTGGTSSSAALLRTDDLGETWYPLNTGLNTRLNAIDFVDDSTGYAAGIAGKILKTEDKGISWIQQACPNASYDHIDFIDENLGFAYAGQSIYKTTNGGMTWISINMNENQPMVSPNPNNGIFTIQLPEINKNQNVINVKIANVNGIIVFNKSVFSTEEHIPVDLSGNSPGVYFVNIRDEMGKTVTAKFVKQ